jgi:hypothetical protein
MPTVLKPFFFPKSNLLLCYFRILETIYIPVYLYRVKKKYASVLMESVAIFKKYLQCVLAARILTVDFVVCTLAVKKRKSGQVSTCRIGPFPCKF